MRHYCTYCGRVAHRCACADENSRLRQFIARSQHRSDYTPSRMDTHYKRGVPPQIKRKERYQLRKHYDEWYSALVVQYGEQCANCGRSADEADLVLDHIQSIARGGTSRPDNLQILCEECNRIKHKLCIDCREWQSD